MKKVDISEFIVGEPIDGPVCVMRNGEILYVAVPSGLYNKMKVVESLIEKLDGNREGVPAEEVYCKAEELYGKLPE